MTPPWPAFEPSPASAKLRSTLLRQLGLTGAALGLLACGPASSGNDDAAVTTSPEGNGDELGTREDEGTGEGSSESTTGEDTSESTTSEGSTDSTTGDGDTTSEGSTDSTTGDGDGDTTGEDTTDGPIFDLGVPEDLPAEAGECVYADAMPTPEIIAEYGDCALDNPLYYPTEVCTDLPEGMSCEEVCTGMDGLCVELISCGDPWSFSYVDEVCGPIEKDGMCCNLVTIMDIPLPGRPFSVDGEARLPALAAPVADELANYWAQLARAEHASVASFARFAIQLQGLGAPPQLVREALQAARDELRHAELCVALASRFAKRPIHTGPLSIAGALARPQGVDELEAVVRSVVLEGCIDETLAAHEAARSAELSRDPQVAAALRGIAADEARHASLAWRFVAWALARAPSLRPLVIGLIESAHARCRRGSWADHAETPAAPELGYPSSRQRAAWRHVGFELVIAPCLASLRAPARAV